MPSDPAPVDAHDLSVLGSNLGLSPSPSDSFQWRLLMTRGSSQFILASCMVPVRLPGSSGVPELHAVASPVRGVCEEGRPAGFSWGSVSGVSCGSQVRWPVGASGVERPPPRCLSCVIPVHIPDI